MKQVIRLTEGDLHRIVKETVEKILREGNAWGSYPMEDQNEAMLDMNWNDRSSGEWADAYLRGDPMVQKVKGSTLRDMLKARMGNDIQS